MGGGVRRVDDKGYQRALAKPSRRGRAQHGTSVDNTVVTVRCQTGSRLGEAVTHGTAREGGLSSGSGAARPAGSTGAAHGASSPPAGGPMTAASGGAGGSREVRSAPELPRGRAEASAPPEAAPPLGSLPSLSHLSASLLVSSGIVSWKHHLNSNPRSGDLLLGEPNSHVRLRCLHQKSL